MRHLSHAARALVIGALCLTVTACRRGSAGDTELAFCDAVARNDVAAAKAIFDAGQIAMMARDLSGRCQPGRELLQAAKPQFQVFTAMAVAFARRAGVANASWSGSGSAARRTSGGTSYAIEIAAQNANAAVMRALIESGATMTDRIGGGALADAANQGSLEIVKLMVEHGADPSAAINRAVSMRQPAIVEYLESKGARERVDPLLIAARRGDVPAVESALAAHADLEVADDAGRTPLIRAALYGHAPVVTRLARAGAKLDAVTTDDKHSALLIAATEGHVAVIQALAGAKADMDIRAGADAPTPLLAAIVNNQLDSVHALLAAGADANAWTENDTTAVRRAAVQGNLAMVKALLAAGARVNDRHGAGWQPPILALLEMCGNAPEGEGENDYYRVTLMKTLVPAGADGTAKTKAGTSPVEVVSQLLAGTQEPFYRACYQAKLDFLRAR